MGVIRIKEILIIRVFMHLCSFNIFLGVVGFEGEFVKEELFGNG